MPSREVIVGGTGFTEKVTSEALTDEFYERFRTGKVIGETGIRAGINERQIVRYAVDSFIEYMCVLNHGPPNRRLTLDEMLGVLDIAFESPSKGYQRKLDELAVCVTNHSAEIVAEATPPEVYKWLADHYPDKFSMLKVDESAYGGRPLSGSKRGRNASKTPDGT